MVAEIREQTLTFNALVSRRLDPGPHTLRLADTGPRPLMGRFSVRCWKRGIGHIE